MEQLKLFTIIVYNNFRPRNIHSMHDNLAFVVSALLAMSED